jgi:hypothetical protein
LSTLFAFVVDFSPFYIASPRVEDEVNFVLLDRYCLIPYSLLSLCFSLSFERIFFP